MITLNIQLVNKIIILFAATNKCQFFVSSYQRALQKSQEGKIRYKKIIIAGYTKSDLDFFYLVRQIPQWKKEGKLLNDRDFDKQAQHLLQYQYSKFFTIKAI